MLVTQQKYLGVHSFLNTTMFEIIFQLPGRLFGKSFRRKTNLYLYEQLPLPCTSEQAEKLTNDEG